MGVRWATDRVNGDEYDVPRRPGDDDCLAVSLAKGVGLLALLVPWYALRHPGTTAFLVVSAWLATTHGVAVLLAVYTLAAVVLGVWRWTHPSSFTRAVGDPFRSRVRGGWVYRRRWRTAMHMCGLSTGWGSERYAPHIVRVRSNAFTDRVRVKLLMGQSPADFETRTDELASTFGATGCRVETVKPGVIVLHFAHADALAATVPALEPSETVDLEALPVGMCESGDTWRLRLLGTHALVVGATGAGKGSVIWSTLRALGPGVRDGWVQVWALDPKGGIELALGAAMFTRFAHDPEPMVTVNEDAATLVQERAARMRGITRLHQPSPSEPFVLLVIDELAFLTAYMPDRALSKRMASALSVVLSQGRAVGVSVMGAVQDPRKEIVAVRDLFPTRIALRLTERGQVDMVLGDGARERGAHCDRIPETTPGVGYVLIDGHREPVRVRAAHVTDADIHAMRDTYASPGHSIGATPLDVIAGEVAA
ncbi:cell division protein FtsK [Phytoactinopolyspora alkaliphila]|uniref:Cell division protein FtsK n=1 Tax=Phytoactinopolyspora alkaliphila TaxID=1783498 RepID=A0A6N9YLV2_9ACTN|nr:FtsK/SpoIIIE domain-containing protein [Phytoactinopolyspora alkaliphila]NED95849.1 cell division protein FtsK [Phytoactinopolyspora alkaliphila]